MEDATSQPWDAPGAQSLAPGIHRVPLPIPNDGLHAVNVYIIRDGPGITLVDAGWEHPLAFDALVDALHVLDADVGDISRVLVTHAHRDHYTLAMRLRDLSGAEVMLGAGENDFVTSVMEGWGRRMHVHVDRLRRAGAGSLADRMLVWLRDPPSYASSTDHYEMPDLWLEDGARLRVGEREFTVIHTPGHTAGHVVFASEADGLLFGGDHLLPHITPSIGFEPMPRPGSLTSYLSSLERMKEYGGLRLLPAHGPASEDVGTRARELLAHHEERLAAMLAVARRVDGAVTAHDVALGVPWTGRGRSLVDLDVFHAMLAVSETAFHLTELVRRGDLEIAAVRPVESFRARRPPR